MPDEDAKKAQECGDFLTEQWNTDWGKQFASCAKRTGLSLGEVMLFHMVMVQMQVRNASYQTADMTTAIVHRDDRGEKEPWES